MKKKLNKLLIFVCFIFVVIVNFSISGEGIFDNQNCNLVKLADSTELIKPEIIVPYENNVAEFVYNGQNHSINAELTNGSNQEIQIFRILGTEEEQVKNEFCEIGVYSVYLTARANYTYASPDKVYLTVIVYPSQFIDNNSYFESITVSSSNGYDLDTTYNSDNIKKSERRQARKLVKKNIEFTEKVVSYISLNASNLPRENNIIDVKLELPKNFNSSKNLRIFVYKDNQIEEKTYEIVDGYIYMEDLDCQSIVVATINKSHPYLWIMCLTMSVVIIGIFLTLFFTVKRNVSFYLDGQKIYSVKVKRKHEILLTSDLNKFDWYKDKNCFVKVDQFKIKEKSLKFYTLSSLKDMDK